jgi:DnaJ-domain-containing protein 1
VQRRRRAARRLDTIIDALANSDTVEEAAQQLGISRRSLFYQLREVSPDDFNTALLASLRFERFQLRARTALLQELRADYDAAVQQNQRLAAENQVLKLFQGLTPLLPQANGTTDAYATLGVRPDAPREVIEAAHKALARTHHPDRGGKTADMQRINAAYQEITKRKR